MRHAEVRAPQASLRSLRMLGCVRASKHDAASFEACRKRGSRLRMTASA